MTTYFFGNSSFYRPDHGTDHFPCLFIAFKCEPDLHIICPGACSAVGSEGSPAGWKSNHRSQRLPFFGKRLDLPYDPREIGAQRALGGFLHIDYVSSSGISGLCDRAWADQQLHKV